MMADVKHHFNKSVVNFWQKHYNFGVAGISKLRQKDVFALYQSLHPNRKYDLNAFGVRTGLLGVKSKKSKNGRYYYAVPISPTKNLQGKRAPSWGDPPRETSGRRKLIPHEAG